MEYFSDFVSLAEDKEEWVEAIGKELGNDNDNKRQSRVEFAGGHTWENNVNEIYKLIAKS
jgi:ribulose-5-phosphate 4-epimerase/fuculose-1-phosphate aldolase